MNILHTETLFGWGGEQNKVLKEMLFMRERGHNVFLFCNPDSQIALRAQNLDFEVITCKMSKKTYPQSIFALLKTIKSNQISLVISHASTDSWVCAITRMILKVVGFPCVFMRERHNCYPIKGFASKLLHKFLFDKILYISESVKQILLNIGVCENRCFYLTSCVDTQKLMQTQSSFREEFGIAKDALVIGTFTSLYPKKGVFDFANAAKEVLKVYPEAIIVFGGKISEGIKEAIAKEFESQSKVIFTGFREDALNVIKAFDVYVFASHTEGLGTVLLEAMCSGVPIVVYDQPPMSVLIEHKQRGLCAKYLDSTDLSRQILCLIKDKNAGEAYAQNALNYVKNFDDCALKSALMELIKQTEQHLKGI